MSSMQTLSLKFLIYRMGTIVLAENEMRSSLGRSWPEWMLSSDKLRPELLRELLK